MDFGQKSEFLDQTQILISHIKNPTLQEAIIDKSSTMPEDSNQTNEKENRASSELDARRAKIFIAIIALIHGFYDLAGLSLLYYQKDIYKLDPQFIQLFGALMLLPFGIKPVFGYISDAILNKIGKTRFVFMVTSAARVLIYFLYLTFDLKLAFFYVLLFSVNLCQLFENIMCEYVLVLTTKKENHERDGKTGNDLPIFFGFKCVGSLCGNFFGGRLIEHYGLKFPFMITSIAPFLVILVACIYNEPKRTVDENSKRSVREEVAIIKQLIFSNGIFSMLVLICLINAAPSFEVLSTFYLIDILKFSTSELANLSTFTTVCYLIGLIAYSQFFKSVNPKHFYLSTNFVYLTIRALFLLVVFKVIAKWGLDEKLFCLLNYGATSFISELNFMPIIAIWCGICPQNLEATAITVLTGLLNLSYGIGEYIGAFLCWTLGINKSNVEKIWLPLLIQCCYLSVGITAVVFVNFPTAKSIKQANSAESENLEIELKNLKV